ncbi:unnamed protein product [Lactuca saligna]|uniref:BED-type domain-containing protein n=1 Tax=Lactuca saligna TaxID=75948 RepID=A0AA36EBP1_LACSI|nr:unnamed protein product [Lactuca saligna]
MRPPPANPFIISVTSLASSNVFSGDFRLSITLLNHVLITTTFLEMANKREIDPGWAYETKVEGNSQWVQCNLCSFVSRGEITRHKHHLAGDTAQVAKCSKVPAEVKAFFKETFDKKKPAKEAMNSIPHFDDVVDLDKVDDDELNTQKRHCPVSSSGSTATNKNTKGPMHACYNQSETVALNEDEEMKIHVELPIYRSAQGIFGNPIAKKMRVKIAPDPTEWLMGGEEEEEDAPVFEGENLTWGQVADAVGACEPPYSTRSRNKGAVDKSASSSRGR